MTLVANGYDLSGTAAQRKTLSAEEAGQIYFNSTTGRLEVWTGTEWIGAARPMSGDTASRPGTPGVGQLYFDTTLGKLIVWSGAAWIEPDGGTPEVFGAGTAAGTGVVASERGDSNVHKTILTLTNTPVVVADSGGANGGFGGLKIYDFPEGNILILGATSDLNTAATGGIGATAALVGSLGTAIEASNATLDSTQANVMPSTSGTLTASAGTLDGQSTGTAIVDGTATAADLIVNIGVPDADISANGQVTLTGTITIVWQNLGDN